MANVASAGTLVSATLETAGYLSQESILQNFTQLFSALGVLLFVICAIGAFISYAVFGSYNLAKYLVVGPVLFYFLVGTTSPTKGVIAKLGGGLPRTEKGVASSEDEAIVATRKLATEREVGVDRSSQVLNRDIAVAWPFRIYTTVVGRMANMLSDLVLKNENEDDLLFATKTQAFEALMNQDVENRDLLQMLQGDLLVQCNVMMNASLMLASPQLGEQERNQLRIRMASPEYQANRDSFRNSLAKMDKEIADYNAKRANGEQKIFSASRELRNYVQQTAGVSGSAAATWLQQNSDKQANAAPLTMACKDGWKIIEEKLLSHAKELGEKLQENFSGALAPADKNRLCVTLANKVGYNMLPSETEKCQRAFVEITAIFLLKNAIATRDQSNTVQRIKNDMQVLADIPKGSVILNGDGASDLELMCGTKACAPGEQGYDYDIKVSPDGTQSQMVARYRRKETGSEEWRSVTVTDEVGGHMTAAFKAHQRYQTRELRQKIFTLAMQFPYYQGMLLYLLSVGYPFFALIVLVPGRATNFFSFLLTWLWIKSWDVGFAFVIVLEKVLWNLVPTTDFDQTFAGGRKISDQPLPVILSEAMKVDPSFNVHIYYFFLSLAMFSVPLLTAYWTLKLRSNNIQNAIQPMVDSLLQSTDDAAQAAGGALGMSVMNISNAGLKELVGTAGNSVGFRGQAYQSLNGNEVISGGLEGEGRGDRAAVFAGISAGSKLVRKIGSGSESFSKSPQEILAAAAGYKSDFASAYKDSLTAEINYDSAKARLYHKVLGRGGDASMMTDAIAAALDGAGGFEVNDPDDLGRVLSTKTARFLSRYGTVVDAAGNLAGGVAGIHAKAPGYGTLVGLIGNMPGVNEAMNWYQFGTTGQNKWEEYYKEIHKNQMDPPNVEFVKRSLQWVEQLMRNKGLSQEEIDELMYRRKLGLRDNPLEIPELANLSIPNPDALFDNTKPFSDFYFINRTVEPYRF